MEVPKLSNVRIIREKLKWTQKQLADAVGIGQSYIAKIESNKQIPSYEIASLIFHVLNEELLKQDKNPPIIRNIATKKSKLRSLHPLDTLSTAFRQIGDVDQLPVIEDDRCVGVITSQILLRMENTKKSKDTMVKEIMEGPLPAFSETTPISQMRDLMRHFSAAMVLDMNGKVSGIITRSDFF
ncbi:hypothetical protein NEF87_001893 [Candidatus Lokiarchaeum ossiferum]|uniref:HTH cro/C1-type domain-containing protein n=1 Tax=Candidatus Lokiarchaeum ossiferum TaxID=2951803 RepID=A0ABY6HQ16_9ARCH|nr:hypothetical protein NEF87_001893 [Candidatus Lokiarchaeum sp. B-35]